MTDQEAKALAIAVERAIDRSSDRLIERLRKVAAERKAGAA